MRGNWRNLWLISDDEVIVIGGTNVRDVKFQIGIFINPHEPDATPSCFLAVEVLLTSDNLAVLSINKIEV